VYYISTVLNGKVALLGFKIASFSAHGQILYPPNPTKAHPTTAPDQAIVYTNPIAFESAKADIY
jgi:hypothetical protein